MLKFDEDKYRNDLTAQVNAIADGKKIADEITKQGYDNIFFVGVGGTYAMMMNFVTLAKQYTKIPVYLEQAGELVLVDNPHLTKNSLVITGSKSGDTKEIVNAEKWLKEKGIRIAAMVMSKESAVGELCDWRIPLQVFKGVEFEYLSMYGIFYGLLADNGDFPRFDEFYDQIKSNMVEGIINTQKNFDNRAEEIAKKYYNTDYQMWIGGGELWGEVYLYTMCILEEMQWLKTKAVTSAEFFHGTLELVDKDLPVFLVKSVGKYRPLDERVEAFLKKENNNLTVFDINDYMIKGFDKEFQPIISPIISTIILNGRLSKHLESHSGHDLDMRRYYRQFKY
ncbi:SIS domain-containing protein [Companilactobacillus pabuli]|jgi:fructoselysine-6-phosphate deglycase|uniref:Fructosamine deglycase n=1 Tax=Companilactobacillus pabuli TaxID=2714036 RepID=A0A7L7KYU5_9LACO|nr:SIS domain-containing protein [Companilactobacillus pabuli]AKP02771.1 glucosamine--fructose-6-phosphate aminotransferase [Companilactobacillus farciminis]AKS51069.1 glucosamine--fructose-6-phosphate aminotransferase [Companilactobacillus farciminis]MDG5114218.1 SIS domain-containing protein [Companilactobacillus pabuli]QMT84953.1 SIS domain-containing protein [Companilactobacillus pabuli]